MEVNKILDKINYLSVVNKSDFKMSGIFANSKQVEANSIFVCLVGEVDGHSFAAEAVRNGAVCLVVNKQLDLPVMQIIVNCTREAFSIISKTFYGEYCDKLKIIMLVGTNGKTSTSCLLNHILKDLKCALIGTNGIFFEDKQLYYGLTTPDPNDLHYYFKQLYLLGARVVVMESSAHAIHLKKLAGIEPSQIIYTNITEEHLDYFKTMQCYANTKIDYVLGNLNTLAIVNADCVYANKILKNKSLAMLSYGLKNPADAFSLDIETSIFGTKFVVNAMDNILNIDTNLCGIYNVYNVMAAILSALALNVEPKQIEQRIKSFAGIAGRMDRISLDCNNLIVIDFAHTPDGFLNVLSEIKKHRNGKIIVVFGCVGYSDFNKRKEMGKIANMFADKIVLTADNPNFESVKEICADIEVGVGQKCDVFECREQAIEFALKQVYKNDTLVLLGKGCENFNLVNGVKVPHNDKDCVTNQIKKQFNFKGENFGNGIS